MVSFTPRPLFPPEEEPPVPIGKKVGWAPEPVRTTWRGAFCENMSKLVVPKLFWATTLLVP
jgi:hypothetical protein